MKFAIINGERCEAAPGLTGVCPLCGRDKIAKCGGIRIWHWAHKQRRHCDKWWEPETEWHRSWKNCFPLEWQENIEFSDDGEKHIADVKTESGTVIEFQNSHLPLSERRAREDFYSSMVWVVNGLRRKRDEATFRRLVNSSIPVRENPVTHKISWAGCPLTKEWQESAVPVYFDFRGSYVWRMAAKKSKWFAYVSPIDRASFIEAYKNGYPEPAGVHSPGIIEISKEKLKSELWKAIRKS